MDLPASYYGDLDKRNPVISAFERDVKSFLTLIRRVASSSQDRSSFAKGIKILVEIWQKYKHRLPLKMYQERMLQVADVLFGMKLYQLALWQGYSLHLLHISSVKITDITDVDHFMACFFPEGFDTDQDTLTMKVRAMHGCALCVFELEKRPGALSQNGLCKLLQVLNFIRVMIQAFQQQEHLCWHIYNSSLHIYTICRYLMTMNCSAQALEYLLWASISLELSIPLMTAKNLPWIVTLYCAVCYCYYDNQAAAQAEEFARRALGKINELAKMETQSDIPATRETQRAYREASIKLAAMVFKRAVFEAQRKPKPMNRKSPLKDTSSSRRTTTENMLMSLFDSSAGQFLGILEALCSSTRRPLQTSLPDDPELQEVFLELLSAGTGILSGATTASESLSALTPTSTLLDLAIAGENQVPIMSAVRFVKLLFQYKQADEFSELARGILQREEGPAFRRAELELALFDCYNSALCSLTREDNKANDRNKSCFSMSDELTDLVDTLHKSVCGSAPEVQPDGDLVVDVLLFLWGKVMEFKHHHQKADKNKKWLWSLSMLCEVALASDLATLDYIMTIEMIHTLATRLESTAEHCRQTQRPAHEKDNDGVKPRSFSLLESSRTELLQKVCEFVERGLEVLDKGVAPLLPQHCSAITDLAFMQKCNPVSSSTSLEEENGEDDLSKEEKDVASDTKESQDAGSTHPSLLAVDLHLELNIIHHRASLKLLQLKAVTEPELLGRIKQNKVSKALFLTQKALLVSNTMEPKKSSNETKRLLEEATTLIEKAGVEERKLYISTTCRTPADDKDQRMREDNPPPPPILLSRTDHTLIFAPAPYNLEGDVCWYQLCGRAAEGINHKVRLGDCSLPGTGNMVPAGSGECVLKVEGLEPNQKYVFAVAAYNNQGKLLGSSIGASTSPLLASMPVPLLSAWAHLAQVAFQTRQYAVAQRACRELWSHYTYSDSASHSSQDRLATTGLRVQTLRHSSSQLCQLFLTSIFIETEINIEQGSLDCYALSDDGPFIWEQEARLAECERMLVAMDLAMWLSDGSSAVQAVVNCYGLLAPLIFHQISCDPVVQVLKKCLIVLEVNSDLLKQKWTGGTSESFLHMIACITFYLSKALRALGELQMVSVLIDCGRKLLQEVYEAQLQFIKLPRQRWKTDCTADKGKLKMGRQMRALHLKRGVTSDSDVTEDNETSHLQAGCEDPTVLYNLISNNTLKDAYQDLRKHRHKTFFVEFAALFLQRTLEEDCPDMVLKWGQSVFKFLSRRDEDMGLFTKKTQRKIRSNGQKANELQPNQSVPQTMLKRFRSKREVQAVENLLSVLLSVVQRSKKRIQLRTMCSEERVWRSHLNYSMAQAHLALLYQSLDHLLGGDLQHRYSQLNPLCFSLPYSGILVWCNSQQQQPSRDEVVPERETSCHLAAQKDRRKNEVAADDSATDESSVEGETPFQNVLIEHGCTGAKLLNKAALHLQRAMVLAHRGSHWTFLQRVCQTVWDQSCRFALIVQTSAQLDPPCPITADQLHSTFTPLLVLATDLIMDMLNKLGLWSRYDSDLTEEELESSLRFSAPLDDSTQADLRWVRTLVLHTLKLLHEDGKWESLAHFALLFNSYTRERYASIITPLLVHAQRRLLKRIRSLGGPAVPQPHHVKTQKATGNEVTCQSYADSQLLSGWTPHCAQQTPIDKKEALKNSSRRGRVDLKAAEMQHAMSLVRVPLDVEDTLSCFRQALERRPHSLQVFQHSRSLLLLLLAYTQPSFGAQPQRCQSRGHSASRVHFSPIMNPTPNVQPCDLTKEDYSMQSALYSLPISHEHIPTVATAYSISMKYLQANGHDSLRVLALHEMGNLQFYNGNTRAAHSYWSKAVDCSLQSNSAVEKWDGVSFGGSSLQQTLKKSGIWGCLHAAGLTAKIAQYILTSDISQRTKCCLLSAHLFKCVLCCSLAHPQADLQYAHHSIGEELLPGVDLFSEHHRVHLGTTVTSLNFICHWLFTTGYYITLLPTLAVYLHFVGTVCRDVRRTVEGKILKIRALTELCLFTEAVKESVQLTQGTGVPVPSKDYIVKDFQYSVTSCLQVNKAINWVLLLSPLLDSCPISHAVLPLQALPVKMFCSSKSLLDNAEALEELVNCDFSSEVRALYGPTLCLRFNLARTQLVLALSNTIHGPPASDPAKGEADATVVNAEEKVLVLDVEEKLTPERMKFLLLEGASTLLHSTSQQLTSQACSEIENLELTIEFNLLKANLHLQHGQAALSSEMAVSSLMLLQSSPVIAESRSISDPHLTNAMTGTEQGTKGCHASAPLHRDCPKAVEASERIGVSLWQHCRLALVRSLAVHNPGSATLFPGKNKNEETARVLQEGLDESAKWGDLDIQALLMVEGAELKAHRGKFDDSMAVLQEAVSLLTGRTWMPPGSTLTLARATLLLCDLQGTQSTTLLKLTQKLLKKQLCLFGQTVVLDNGKTYFPPPGPSNIYLPYIKILEQATLQIEKQVASRQPDLRTQNEETSQEPIPPLSNANTSSPSTLSH